MRILHISYIETNSGWGAECFVDDALEKLGHTVYKIDFKKYFNELTTEILKYEDFDILFLQRGDWFPKEILRCINRPCVFWASELISRCRDQDRLLYSGLFDHFFVHSSECVKTLDRNLRRKNDETEVSCLLNAYDDKLHRKLSLTKDIDVLFIGSITERRKIILDELKSRIDIKVCENVFGEQFVEMVNRAKIVINIHSAKHLDTETRVFEVLGCGSFLLSEKLSEENPFIAGKHYVETDISQFEMEIEKYLGDEELREKIAAEGHEEATNKHSYFARTRDSIIPILEKCVDKYDNDGRTAIDRGKIGKYKKMENSLLYRLSREKLMYLFEKYQHLIDKMNVR